MEGNIISEKTEEEQVISDHAIFVMLGMPYQALGATGSPGDSSCIGPVECPTCRTFAAAPSQTGINSINTHNLLLMRKRYISLVSVASVRRASMR